MLYSQRGNNKNKNKVRQHHSFKTNKQNCSGYFSKAICFYHLPCQFPNSTNVANPNRLFQQSRPICRSVIQLRLYPTIFDMNLKGNVLQIYYRFCSFIVFSFDPQKKCFFVHEQISFTGESEVGRGAELP